jgi:hypothetical protein
MSWSGERRGFVIEAFFKNNFGRASGSMQLMPFLVEKQSCDGFQM